MNCCEELYKGIVSVKEFNAYSNNYEDAPEIQKLKVEVLSSATQVVEEYLGYRLLEKEYKEEGYGNGGRYYYTQARPVTNVNIFAIEGAEVPDELYEVKEDGIRLVRKIEAGTEVFIEYTAGYAKNRVPEIFKTTILRIASLMLTEANGNIGITSKSMDGNTRTFLNYTNYDKYLRPLEVYRAVRL